MKCFLCLVALTAAAFTCFATEPRLSGATVPGMESVDDAYSAFMKRREIPGGSVAILKDGRLVY
ncbi:MAG: hypothetical protein ACI8UO_006637, partial [Verrucomicrobiales bacterium]